tara:strand:- start:15803 stop:17110 length:1308 start_codon:yes stop_codon:yes gene_type:complete
MSSGNKIAMPVKSKDFSMEEMNSHGVLTPYRMAKDLHSSDSVVQPRITVQSIREANEKKEVLKQLELANALADKLASVGQPEHDGSFLAKHPPTSDPFRPAYPDVSNATDSERGTTIFPNKLIEMLVYGMIRTDKTGLTTAERLLADREECSAFLNKVNSNTFAYADACEESLIYNHAATFKGFCNMNKWPYANQIVAALQTGFSPVEMTQSCAKDGHRYDSKEATRRTQSMVNAFMSYKRNFIGYNEGLKAEVFKNNEYYRSSAQEVFYNTIHWFTNPLHSNCGQSGAMLALALSELPGVPTDPFMSFAGYVIQAAYDLIVANVGRQAANEGIQFLRNNNGVRHDSSFRVDNTVFSMMQYYGYLEVADNYDPELHTLQAQAAMINAIILLSKENNCSTYETVREITMFAKRLIDEDANGGNKFEAHLINDTTTL